MDELLKLSETLQSEPLFNNVSNVDLDALADVKDAIQVGSENKINDQSGVAKLIDNFKKEVWTKGFRKHYGLKLKPITKEKSQSPNELCNCGSNNKYKKCCMFK